jgi:endo-1,3(4)-beta-glucanase
MSYLVVAMLSVVGLSILAPLFMYQVVPQSAPTTQQQVLPEDDSILNRDALNTLPKQKGSSAYTGRLAADIIPPTNSWISGLALQKDPLPVFTMPLSFKASDRGFESGLPTITADATTITGGHTAGIEAKINGSSSFQLTRFDKISAQLSYKSGENLLGNLTIAQGSPYVFYRADSDTEITLAGVQGGQGDGTYHRYTKGESDYVLTAHEGATIASDAGTVRVTIPKGGLVTFYGLAAGMSDTLRTYSGNELQQVRVENEQKDGQSLTRLRYETKNGQETVLSPMPYIQLEGGESVQGEYKSIYGSMKLYRGVVFTTSVPLLSADNSLQISTLSDARKNALSEQLRKDNASTKIDAKDAYFAGKQLARAASLLDIAEQLGETRISKQLQAVLQKEFDARLGPKYFYYDQNLRGVAAKTQSFRSEDFNDHHFHYGYFIYAASILGKYDAPFVEKYKDQINLLAADIASYENYDEFPLQRTYDPYSAHSWAAGLAPFADGNNQESSSEAINAWNGVAMWAQLIGNRTLEQTAQWMLSNEAATAARAWRNVDTRDEYLKAYTSPVASLSFGGKRTYNTFFSNESNAKLAIQLIPMSPVMESFAEDGQQIRQKLDRQDKPLDFNVALGDYMLMYYALADPKGAERALSRQSQNFIDNGNSLTYIMAWVYNEFE